MYVAEIKVIHFFQGELYKSGIGGGGGGKYNM